MILLFIFLLLILMFYTYQIKWNPIHPDFYCSEEIIKIGHRGAPALAPGNTIESFIIAFKAGIKVLSWMSSCQKMGNWWFFMIGAWGIYLDRLSKLKI